MAGVRQIDLSLIPATIEDLRYLAIKGHPLEVCGIIQEYDIIYECANIFDGDRRHGFDMEVDVAEKNIKAIWHSHPNGLAQPSKDDLPCMELMATHGLVFPWIIVTPKSVTAWQYLLT